MGIPLTAVHLLAQTLPLLDDLSDKRLLTLGVQDCYFTYDQIVTFLRRHGIPHQPLSADEVLLTTAFKWAPPAVAAKYRNCIHQNTLFTLLGFSPRNIHSMDVSEYEGADIVHDLNLPVGDLLRSRFDLILDSGTIEHVFSIKDALFNMCRMCKVGGIVVNKSPADFINHGFINLNAEVLRDCYLSNGFEEMALKYIATPTHPRRGEQHYMEYTPEEFRFALRPYYATEVYAAYKKIEEKALTVPLQGLYRKLFSTGPVVARPEGKGLRAVVSEKVRAKLRDWVDAHFVSSLLIRGFANIWWGKKVIL